MDPFRLSRRKRNEHRSTVTSFPASLSHYRIRLQRCCRWIVFPLPHIRSVKIGSLRKVLEIGSGAGNYESVRTISTARLQYTSCIRKQMTDDKRQITNDKPQSPSCRQHLFSLSLAKINMVTPHKHMGSSLPQKKRNIISPISPKFSDPGISGMTTHSRPFRPFHPSHTSPSHKAYPAPFPSHHILPYMAFPFPFPSRPYPSFQHRIPYLGSYNRSLGCEADSEDLVGCSSVEIQWEEIPWKDQKGVRGKGGINRLPKRLGVRNDGGLPSCGISRCLGGRIGKRFTVRAGCKVRRMEERFIRSRSD